MGSVCVWGVVIFVLYVMMRAVVGVPLWVVCVWGVVNFVLSVMMRAVVGVTLWVVCVCGGCCDFCLICDDAWCCRCSFMGSVCGVL